MNVINVLTPTVATKHELSLKKLALGMLYKGMSLNAALGCGQSFCNNYCEFGHTAVERNVLSSCLLEWHRLLRLVPCTKAHY